MRCVAFVVLVGCATANMQVGLRPADLRDHAAELRANNEARIATVNRRGGDKVKFGDIETVFLDQTVTVAGRVTTLAALLAACEPDRPDCVFHRDGDLIVLRVIPAAELRAAEAKEATPDPSGPHTNGYNPRLAAVTGILTLASVAGTAGCLIACDDKNWAWLPAGSGLVFLVIWAVSSGARD